MFGSIVFCPKGEKKLFELENWNLDFDIIHNYFEK